MEPAPLVYGSVRLSPPHTQAEDSTLHISELPLRTWTSNYKESVLEPMLTGGEK